MQELISPEQSDKMVLIASLLLTLGGALWGYRLVGARGIVAGVLGPLVFGLWQGHKWITRYEPQTGYFGLDKVWVLALEIIVFVAIGAALGIIWSKIISRTLAENAEKK